MRKPGPVVHVVVTCSNRKRVPVPPSLSARTLPDVPVCERANEWIRRLSNSGAPLISVLDLYGGEHWSVVRSLPSVATGARTPVDLWILSAGYGLIPADAKVRPYAATFSSGHADTVGANGSRRQWWQLLTRWAGLEPGAPRSLDELAKQNPTASIVIAVSPPYLDACSDDVTVAAGVLRRPEQLSVICTGASRTTLPDHMLPGDARLQYVLGGTRQALNVRVLAHLLREHRGPFTRDAASDALDRLLSRQPALVHQDRRRCSDAEVAIFIRTRLRTDPSLSHSRLLRDFRDDGYACEQSRFAALFATERAGL
jgi:hypothetical protein